MPESVNWNCKSPKIKTICNGPMHISHEFILMRSNLISSESLGELELIGIGLSDHHFYYLMRYYSVIHSHMRLRVRGWRIKKYA